MYRLSIYSGLGEELCKFMWADECPLEVTDRVVLRQHQCNITAWMKPHLFSLSLISFSPCLHTARGRVSPNNSYDYITTLIQGLMPSYYLAIRLFCAVQCVEMRGWWEIQGLANQKKKSSYTVHFPCALIGMSTVKAPPMRRLGAGRRGEERGRARQRIFSVSSECR